MVGTNTVRALIFPAEIGYNAICLDLCAIVRKQPTKNEAAKAITMSIDEWILGGIRKNIPFDKLHRTAISAYQKAYVSSESSYFTPSFQPNELLTPEVKELVSIEYKYFSKTI